MTKALEALSELQRIATKIVDLEIKIEVGRGGPDDPQAIGNLLRLLVSLAHIADLESAPTRDLTVWCPHCQGAIKLYGAPVEYGCTERLNDDAP